MIVRLTLLTKGKHICMECGKRPLVHQLDVSFGPASWKIKSCIECYVRLLKKLTTAERDSANG